MSERFREHLRDIRNKTVGKEVASHFNLPNHSLNDCAVSGILIEPNTKLRQIKEARLIQNLGTLVPTGLNREDDSNYKNYF